MKVARKGILMSWFVLLLTDSWIVMVSGMELHCFILSGVERQGSNRKMKSLCNVVIDYFTDNNKRCEVKDNLQDFAKNLMREWNWLKWKQNLRDRQKLKRKAFGVYLGLDLIAKVQIWIFFVKYIWWWAILHLWWFERVKKWGLVMVSLCLYHHSNRKT